MTIGIWILGDQLWSGQAALQCSSPRDTAVILIESLAHVRVRPYHRQKLVLVWSAMRHFAEELRTAGWDVTYVSAAADFAPALDQWIRTRQITELRVMQPADRPFAALIHSLQLPCPTTIFCGLKWNFGSGQASANGC
jgi:deoxyribodipyrimidine photolyase-related protein